MASTPAIRLVRNHRDEKALGKGRRIRERDMASTLQGSDREAFLSRARGQLRLSRRTVSPECVKVVHGATPLADIQLIRGTQRPQQPFPRFLHGSRQ
ncbi:hypothetical protein HHA02_06190 [Cobetia marina]|nr:hypothetical protein HHA02_06190 [Cobetia marina]